VPAAERYAAARRAAGYASYRSVHALEPLLDHLRGLGVTPVPDAPVPATPTEELLERYHRYLVSERGLGAATAVGYVLVVRPFLAGRTAAGGAGLKGLTAAEVTAFVVAWCPGKPKGSAKLTVTALRSLLGWLHVEGMTGESLAWAVPSVAGWRLARLPRPLAPGQLDALLASCDRATAHGRRDLAMLTLLARLRLRAGEVAALALDDIASQHLLPAGPHDTPGASAAVLRERLASGSLLWRQPPAPPGRRPCGYRCSRYARAAAADVAAPNSARSAAMRASSGTKTDHGA
jgi:hypothetical protein